MLDFLFRAVVLYCRSGLLTGFLSVMVTSGILALIYRLFTVKECFND